MFQVKGAKLVVVETQSCSALQDIQTEGESTLVLLSASAGSMHHIKKQCKWPHYLKS